MAPKQEGPFKIEEVLGPVTYRLKLLIKPTDGYECKSHVRCMYGIFKDIPGLITSIW